MKHLPQRSISGFRLVICLLLGGGLAFGAEKEQKDLKASGSFRFAPVSSNSLGLWEGDKPVLVYNHGSITNAAAPKAESHSCYIHPLYGLDSEVLTEDFPADHLYHRGLYWAWSHIKIGGEEYDLWSIRGIRPQFVRWIEREAKGDAAVLAVENGWFVKDRKVMREEARVRVHRAEAESRAIDLELSWTPLEQPITLWGAPEKSYGGFTLRFGKRSKTIVTVPSGRAPEDLLMTKLPWADLSGDFDGGRISGAAVFVHPEHPDYPPEWMTRDYGVLAVGYPGVKAKTFPAGKTFTCRYRIWVHRGNPEAAEIQKAYDAFRSEAGSR
jgi:hypothetical protein